MLDIKTEISGILINKFYFSLNSTYPILKFNFTSKILHVILAKSPQDILKTPWNLLAYQTISIFLVIFFEKKHINFEYEYNFKLQMYNRQHLNLLSLQFSSFDT